MAKLYTAEAITRSDGRRVSTKETFWGWLSDPIISDQLRQELIDCGPDSILVILFYKRLTAGALVLFDSCL
jgi:hypothetical protein